MASKGVKILVGTLLVIAAAALGVLIYLMIGFHNFHPGGL